MNIDKLIKAYFGTGSQPPVIEVFDSDSIFSVYKDIVSVLDKDPDIELTVLQALSYCFYEILDNVLTHSGKSVGSVLTAYSEKESIIQVLVADDGVGIRRSLASSEKYRDISEAEALKMCVEDSVSDGKGMGFGLYSTMRLIKEAGVVLKIHSGTHILMSDGRQVTVEEASMWQGTLVYFEVHANKEINPDDVVDNRTDCAGEYNDMFDSDDNLDELW